MNAQRFIKIPFFLFLIHSVFFSIQQIESIEKDPLLQIQAEEFEEVDLQMKKAELDSLKNKVEALDDYSFSLVKRTSKTPFYSRFLLFIKQHFLLCNAFPVRPHTKSPLFMEMEDLENISSAYVLFTLKYAFLFLHSQP